MNGTTVKHFFTTKAKSLGKGVLAGLLTSFAMLLLLSGIMLWFSLSLSWGAVLAYIASAIGGFVGGYVVGILVDGKGLLFGAMTGLIIFLVTFFVGLFTEMRFPDIKDSTISLVITLASAAFGGVVGVNRK